MKKIQGSICAPLGFKAAAVFCDIKKLGTGKGSEKGRKLDLALIVSDVPAAVAGMFTANQVCAAPVKVSAEHAARRFARAVVVNSGNANACTGKQGMKDALKMTQLTAETVAAVYLSRRNEAKVDHRYRRIVREEVLVCSTGRIGVTMPMANVARGIQACAPLLKRSVTHAHDTAEAIMTSDTRRKEIAIEIRLNSAKVRIGGICKGAGMIQPGMTAQPGGLHATMLGFITTDADVAPRFLKRALEAAVGQSFNRITVDGDMSTNDTVIVLANGLAGNRRLDSAAAGPQRREFQEALNHVCLELAKMIVRDGEGVSRFVAVRLRGAENAKQAEAATRSVANSSLVRTSWCGGDPNWGRILCALGYSQARIDENRVDIGYSRPNQREILWAFRRGRPTATPFADFVKITSAPEFDIHIDLHAGKGEFTLYASDLTEEYVTFNKGDVSEPASLGG
jgi:glutamate N-acetyltransferase/amino-acid N-acetyltransferase